MTKSQIHETALQKSLSSQETQFYTFVLIQYTWICLFSPIVFATPLVSFFMTYIAIYFTIIMYSRLSQRPISRTKTSMKIWNDFYKVIGYVGIIYNAYYLIVMFDLKPLQNLYKRYYGLEELNRDTYELWELRVIFWLENALLITKFVISLGIKMKSPWLKKRVTRENEMKKKVTSMMNGALVELVEDRMKVMKKHDDVDMPTDPRYNIDPQSENLRLFFKENKRKVQLNNVVVSKEF